MATDLDQALAWVQQRAKDITPQAGVDGEGNPTNPMSLSQMGMGHDDPYRAALFGSFGVRGTMDPDTIKKTLNDIAQKSGVKDTIDWDPYLALAAQQYAADTKARFGRELSYSYKETPVAFPINAALARAAKDHPELAQAAKNTEQGTEFWTKTQQQAHELGRASNRAYNTMVFSALAVAAGGLAGVVGGGSGASGAAAGETAGGANAAWEGLGGLGNTAAEVGTNVAGSLTTTAGAAPVAGEAATGAASEEAAMLGAAETGGGASAPGAVSGSAVAPEVVGGEATANSIGGATAGAEVAESPGIIESVMNFSQANPVLTTGLLNIGGGILKGIGDQKIAEERLQHEKEMQAQKFEDSKALEEWKRKFIQGGSFFDAKLPFSAPDQQRQLRRPDGSVVHGNGLINKAM